MTKNIFTLSLVFIICFSISNTKAQQTTVAGHGKISGNLASASYSIGQLVCNSLIDSDYNATLGIQQAYNVLIIIDDSTQNNLEIRAYPNPTRDFIKLNLGNYEINKLQFFLFDISGKLLMNKNITNKATMIPMSQYIPGIYFIKITDNKKDIKTFKIIKTK
ncbi:MAG: T9SS type A sorting domain-containing protein [Clostridia bacterium]|nr:T9SS type A sorting domain-containing protein [Clostridia bacterium]